MRIAAFLIAPAMFVAANAAQAGELSGKLYQPNGLPAGEHVVAIDALGLETTSAMDGFYTFADLPAGEHEIAVRRIDGAVQHMTIRVEDEADTRHNIMLVARGAVNGALGFEPAAGADRVNLAATLQLAERMSREGSAEDGEVWRWRDLDG